MDIEVDYDTLQEKATEKLKTVQALIKGIESAFNNSTDEDKAWLRKIIDPSEDHGINLTRLFVEPKYRTFVWLRCAALRALQLLIRVARIFLPRDQDHNAGCAFFVELVDRDLATEAFNMAIGLTKGADQNLAFGAIIFLTELGPEAFPLQELPSMVETYLGLFLDLSHRADDLVEVALCLHSWGDERRAELLRATVQQKGGRRLCEVLLQVINRGLDARPSRALKVLTGCLSLSGSDHLMYTNDVRVLVEIIQRELPAQAELAAHGDFACYANCYKALVMRSAPARVHCRDDMLEVLQSLESDPRCDAEVHRHCKEALAIMAKFPR
mmetsp:Transcript_50257/g.106786  ORF Transcript_50257/g.106786 Transcript_50257/m.106786 type:complete len:327 (+) Transcript_50257:74-1054(+)|eukprot:CAMPEP_0206475942 /NCGR_PEP_ID=MMETSP0324_2-20121206/34398_1 /ASSEMBLY_ACC=CAM_ASM_000836 /TAXON_ID=2866 /ORGANISM="Crypthecodinium cohnii, Strain Seligo" /LENGTH=326 /DNA_ID=CAMNT_0053951433 /DNA_START=74 /DNA_END=1054 /DNA_ORIENTATION=+